MITAEHYNEFCTAFYLSEEKDILRFGQAFCNEFDITDSTLFYEKSLIKTRTLIFEKYVENNTI